MAPLYWAKWKIAMEPVHSVIVQYSKFLHNLRSNIFLYCKTISTIIFRLKCAINQTRHSHYISFARQVRHRKCKVSIFTQWHLNCKMWFVNESWELDFGPIGWLTGTTNNHLNLAMLFNWYRVEINSGVIEMSNILCKFVKKID